MKISRLLFGGARLSRTMEVIATGNPVKIAKHFVNKGISKAIRKITNRFYLR